MRERIAAPNEMPVRLDEQPESRISNDLIFSAATFFFSHARVMDIAEHKYRLPT
jgi:hypothetical protein